MADELRAEISRAEYIQHIIALNAQITAIDTLLGEYQTLQRNVAKLSGDGDSNLNKLKESIEENIKTVQGQRQLLSDSRAMLMKLTGDSEDFLE